GLAERERLDARIRACALAFAVAEASVEEIDRLNILQASLLAMRRAVAALGTADLVLVDGNRLPPGLACAAEAIVKGDARCLSIAAASILAKVARDRRMVDLAQQHPGYGWERNAGYPTAGHLRALQDLGVTPVHRRSFGPVHKILYQEEKINP
ncbi:MAG: ribonuclease HII, partial [Anaerolineae bacterium]|nr:ribonuclease HII [Anaerolineae bacterium]